ncbi:hypothetical protein [Pseudomonas aeruginosa]|uniref:hypothetical protein n=1 Tax=Pseudomonas aeruginosa TaxID=287 RepID=UPI0019131C7C|nr:hypothetical protein [Pseudomonas aeruginosa]
MMDQKLHQSQLAPQDNKFHKGNIGDGKHYWLTPPALLQKLDVEFRFSFDPCPYPKPEGFDGLTCEWGASNYVNPPFGSIIHEGKKKGPTAWARKAIAEHQKGKTVVLVYPVDKWILMLMEAGAQVRNLGDVRWLATEDGSEGKGTGRHIACFVLDAAAPGKAQHSVPEEFSFEYRHPNGECHTVTVSREQVINEMPDFLFEALCSKFCNCEPVGETNVVECCCDEYAEEFKLIAAAPGKEVGHE